MAGPGGTQGRSKSGPRGLAPEDIAHAAVGLMEEAVQDGFSLRKLAARVGCDPMAVLYHFGSRLGLERAMADALNAQLVAPERKRPWRERLLDLAQQYRALASRYPRTFPLLQRFWVTGPADYHHAEEVYAALAEAGFGQQGMVDACFGWYAAVLGLAAAEAGGLLRPPSDAQLAEVEGLPEADFPLTRQLLPAFRAQEPDRAFRLMVEAMLDGLERQALAQRSEPAADGAVQFQS